MSTLLDEETTILAGLDFEPPCHEGDKPAVLLMQCRNCGHGALFCREHADKARKQVERLIRRSSWGAVMCGHCKHIGLSFDELLREVPLS